MWITVAMVGARSAAMALNRLIDAEIDARNPRTAGRELPSGLLRRGEVLAFIVVSVAVLVVAAFNLSAPCRYLWPIPVAAFVVYPYTKRFTVLCHYVLGLTDGLAPAAAWVAVTGRVSWAAVLLFLAVGLWVGGFDVIYAIFDLDFDRREGIRSVAVSLGRGPPCASRQFRTSAPCSCSWRSGRSATWAPSTTPAAAPWRCFLPGRTSTSPAAACSGSAWAS